MSYVSTLLMSLKTFHVVMSCLRSWKGENCSGPPERDPEDIAEAVLLYLAGDNDIHKYLF